MLERRWISPKECSLYLSLNLKTIYSKISKGEIPAAKLGGTLRVDKKRLDRLLEDSIRAIDWVEKALK